jgi:alkylation response protein AidB-like acyl-CoA dehydrogenase
MTQEAMLAAASSLTATVEPFRTRMDRERKMPPEIVNIMRQKALLTLWLPVAYGGPGVGALDSIRVIEALAQADGTIGWCACTAAINNRIASFLSPEAAKEIFDGGRTSVAGALMPTGKAVLTEGGYIVSGRWGYASGVDHCSWMLAACAVLESGQPMVSEDGTPQTRIAFFPRDQCEVIDTWEVGGLRGTGSHDYRADDLFVPEGFTVGNLADEPLCSDIMGRYPYYSAQGTAIAPVVLGLAQAALDRYGAIAESRIPRITAAIARNEPCTQEVVGRATAALRSARAFFYDAVASIVDAIEGGSVPTINQRINARLAFAQAAEAAKSVARALHDDSGGAGLYESQGSHRIFRDIHAATQHAQLQKVGFRTSGRVLLGLDPGTARF